MVSHHLACNIMISNNCELLDLRFVDDKHNVPDNQLLHESKKDFEVSKTKWHNLQ